MNRAELVFKAIDVFGNLPQNAVRYSDVVRVQDIPYTEEYDEMNTGDLYFDGSILNDGTKHPILLYIHGGGFIKGDKDYRVTNSEYFAHHGYFVYNIDYRMPPQISLIENFSDVVKAFNHIEDLAKDYNIDTSKIVVSGDSSGGYQTSMLAACAFDDELRKTLKLPEFNNKPAAIALMCGLYDMIQLVSGPRILGLVPETASMILGFKLKSDMSNYTDYEYINFISPVSLVNSKWCPTFMTWANDDMICVGQGPSMAEQLEQNGIIYDTFVADGFQNNHCFHLNMTFRIAQRCMSKCVHFLNTVLNHEDINDTYSEEAETEEAGFSKAVKQRAKKIKDGITKEKQENADGENSEVTEEKPKKAKKTKTKAEQSSEENTEEKPKKAKKSKTKDETADTEVKEKAKKPKKTKAKQTAEGEEKTENSKVNAVKEKAKQMKKGIIKDKQNTSDVASEE